MRNFPKSLLTILSGIISIGIIYHTPLFQKDERQEYSEYIREHAFFPSNKHIETDKAIPQSDRPDLSWQQNYLLTMDPVLMRPAPERLEAARLLVKRKLSEASARPGDNTFPWVERGPNNVGGRTRAIVWDPTDASGKKVWAGGVSGGLWFTSDIYDAAVTWQKVNDFWDNLSISAIAVDPVNNQIMYVGTGEGWGSGASRGDGIWKSTDGGSTWTKLTSSQNFYYINDLIVRNEAGIGVVYAAVRADYYEGSWHGLSAQGLQRSTDEGITFTQVMTNIAGEGEPYAIADLELAADNTLWAGSVDNAYSLTDDGGGSILYSTNGTTWTLSTKRSGSQRVELACAPSNSNVVYALIENNGTVNEVLKTTNAGSTWINISQPNDADTDIPATDFSRGQAWYDLILAVDPTNENTVIAGAIDLFRTTNGGTSWSQLSHWYGGFGFPEIHADQHVIAYKPGSSTDVIFGHDGGIDLSVSMTNAQPAFLNRNNQYNVTQFYSCAIHPQAGMNYFLAGAQDNGTQKFTQTDLGGTSEVTGGDGAYCFIDQLNGNVQISSYVQNSYYISTDGGVQFNSFIDDGTSGWFINPSDYDDHLGILYTATDASSIGRFLEIKKGNPVRSDLTVNMGDIATHLRVSPHTTSSSTLFVGTSAGRLFKIITANSVPQVTELTGTNFPTGSIVCVEIGATEDILTVVFSNYGVVSVWQSSDGGVSWESKEGDLPDMPIRWALYNPNDNNEIILATELGIWHTSDYNAPSPVWTPSNIGLANVRVDMLQIRNSDQEIIAATFGRGLFSSSGFASVPGFAANFTAAPTNVLINDPVNFTDLSTGGAVAWSWTFSGGTPATSQAQHPVVRYAASGLYDVSLTVTDASGNQSTKTMTKFITVSSNATLPNLQFHQPAGWTGFVSLYKTLDLFETDEPLSILDEAMVAYSISNSGKADLTQTFEVDIQIDGNVVLTDTWNFSATDPFKVNTSWYWTNDNIAQLTEGEHTITLVIDPTNVIDETIETDNLYERTFYVQQSCLASEQITAKSGTLSDGSGPAIYLDNRACSWRIQPLGGLSVSLFFTEFSLEDGWDFLYIYDGEDVTTPLYTFTGNTLPQNIFINSPSVEIHFESDGSVGEQGWTLEYNADVLSVDEPTNYMVYPVPASSYLTISSIDPTSVMYTISDLSGRKILDGIVQPVEATLDISGLVPGLYQLTLQNKVRSYHYRFIKQ